jgi:D-3-phosphoglycerate dehydrogenase
MSRGRVLLLDEWSDPVWAREELASTGATVEAAELPEGEDVVALVLSIDTDVGSRELTRLPRLEIVATASTGYDHLDVDALSAAGVWVTHAGDYCCEEVADHAVALVVSLVRRIGPLDAQVRAGGWDVFEHPPARIAGTTLGIVGCGRIGSAVAHRAAALGMRVLAHDPFVAADVVRACGAEPIADLHSLLASSDVVSVHAWLDDTTRGLIGAAELAAMRPGSFLVNCARAPIVDHVALGEALRSGHLGGAGLDVLPVEPPPSDAEELSWPRTIIQPHAAWHSSFAWSEIFRRPVEDVKRVLLGEEPLYPVARPAAR